MQLIKSDILTEQTTPVAAAAPLAVKGPECNQQEASSQLAASCKQDESQQSVTDEDYQVFASAVSSISSGRQTGGQSTRLSSRGNVSSPSANFSLDRRRPTDGATVGSQQKQQQQQHATHELSHQQEYCSFAADELSAADSANGSREQSAAHQQQSDGRQPASNHSLATARERRRLAMSRRTSKLDDSSEPPDWRQLPDQVTIIHFNDCYNIEPGPKSSGAAGFLTAVNQFRHLDPMILFSGDIISPSFMSTFTKGEQMIPVLNDIGVHCAVFGNHEFDYGVDNLIDFTKRTNFPWLLSNVIDKETSNQLGDGLTHHIIERAGLKFGLIGLIEEEWLSTLSTLDSSDVIYQDFVLRGRELARWLKRPPHQVDYVIALTHFRTPNDIRLADSVAEIDLILGGHDHDYEVIERPSCHIVKSGTDFRELSAITLKINSQYRERKRQALAAATPPPPSPDQSQRLVARSPSESLLEDSSSSPADHQKALAVGRHANSLSRLHDRRPIVDIHIQRVDCSQFQPDPTLKGKLEKFVTTIDEKMGKVLGQFNCDLDGRFSSIRRQETNLGNFVTDIMLASTHADLAILNSGTLRSDRVHPRGDFTMRDLFNILGYIDPIAVLAATGEQIWRALENGVSQWPKLEGRFPQVSGCSFAFDPNRPPGSRIDPAQVTVGDEPLVLDKSYKLTTKAYLAAGKDGYDTLRDCRVLVPGDESPDLTTSILNHFEAINIVKSNRRTHHRQSIICLSRSSIKKLLDCETTTSTGTTFSSSFCSQSQLQLQTHSSELEINNNNNLTAGHQQLAEVREGEHLELELEKPKLRRFVSQLSNGTTDTLAAPLTSSPLSGVSSPPAALENIGSSVELETTPAVGQKSAAAAAAAALRRRRSKRLMSLYEMEHEQCKLEPKVEGRIRILGA